MPISRCWPRGCARTTCWQVADAYAHVVPNLFSLEMWGGATFDTSMRFLKECPWQRLADLRAAIPNILFQMLLRASNAVGYTNYPDNVVQAFVKESVQAGMDVFRIFDPLNWTENMRVAMDAVHQTRRHLRSGDLLHRRHPEPEAAEIQFEVLRRAGQGTGKDGGAHSGHQRHGRIVQAVRGGTAGQNAEEEIGIPIHFHTHDTSGVSGGGGAQSGRSGRRYRRCGAGADVGPDVAAEFECDRRSAAQHAARSRASMPNICDSLAHYWQAVREFYTPFESDMKAPDADLYLHEMPGGQFTNLLEQARALGLVGTLGRSVPDVCRRESVARRYRESDADVESRRRFGVVLGDEQSDGRRRARSVARAGVSRKRGRSAGRPHGATAGRLSAASAEANSARHKAG